MKVKTALIILFSILLIGIISFGFVYKIKKNQLANEALLLQKKEILVSTSTPDSDNVLTNDEKKEIGKARAAELLRMMDQANGASSTPLTEEEKAVKVKEGEARAAQLLRMMK